MSDDAQPTGRHPRVRVVVINYLGDDLTLRCLDSLAATEWPADRFEIVVVDNGSHGGFAARLASCHPSARLVVPGHNTGFAGGANAGIGLNGDYDLVALINNDATVSPGWLRPLVDALAEAKVGGASPKVLFEGSYRELRVEVPDAPAATAPTHRRHGVRVDAVEAPGLTRPDEGFFVDAGVDGADHLWCDAEGALLVAATDAPAEEVTLRLWAPTPRHVRLTAGAQAPRELSVEGTTSVTLQVDGPVRDIVNNAGSRLVAGGFSADRGLYEVDEGQFDEPREVTFFYGGAVVLRRDFLDDVGTFDDRLFLYYEDTDLSWRGLLRGWTFRYVPSSVVRHQHGASSGLGSPLFRFQNERNRMLVLLKCAPMSVALRAFAVATKQVVEAAGVAVTDSVGRRGSARRRREELVLRARTLFAALAGAPAMVVTRRRLKATVPFSEPMRRAEPR